MAAISRARVYGLRAHRGSVRHGRRTYVIKRTTTSRWKTRRATNAASRIETKKPTPAIRRARNSKLPDRTYCTCTHTRSRWNYTDINLRGVPSSTRNRVDDAPPRTDGRDLTPFFSFSYTRNVASARRSASSALRRCPCVDRERPTTVFFFAVHGNACGARVFGFPKRKRRARTAKKVFGSRNDHTAVIVRVGYRRGSGMFTVEERPTREERKKERRFSKRNNLTGLYTVSMRPVK